MVQRGDAVFHITADLGAPAGFRLSIHEPDAKNVFRIPHPTNDLVTIGYYLVDLIYADDGTTQIARRQEYRYDPAGSGNIYSRLTFWEVNGWDDRYIGHPALKPVEAPAAYKQDKAVQPALAGGFLPPSRGLGALGRLADLRYGDARGRDQQHRDRRGHHAGPQRSRGLRDGLRAAGRRRG
jgi:hypothetical protein